MVLIGLYVIWYLVLHRSLFYFTLFDLVATALAADCVVGRIREHVAGGAWCPAQPVGKDSTEYLEVDLGRLMVVTLVETQGRFDNGQVSQ